MPACSAASRASLWARTLKPMTAAPDAPASLMSDSGRRRGGRDVGLGGAADAGVDHPGLDLLVADLLERADDRLERALHVGLDDERELLAAGALLEVAHHVGERAAGAGRAGGGALALLPGAV